MLEKMKRAGFVEVMWGLESGSQRVLQLMNKTIFSIKMAEEIIKSASALEISQCANFIVGFPGETEEMFLETAQFVLKNRRYFNNIGLPLLEIRQNSKVFDNYQDYGILDPIPIRWKTVDESNTYELRMARRNLLAALLGEQLFDQGRYTDNDGPASDVLLAGSTETNLIAALGGKLKSFVRRQRL